MAAIQRFLDFIGEKCIDEVARAFTTDEWDDEISDYIENLYEGGYSKDLASRTVHGLAWANPQWGQSVRHALPLAWSSLAGRNRLDPGMSIPPAPVDVVLAIAHVMLECGHPNSGLAVLLMFEGYFRIGEVLSLRLDQFIQGDPLVNGSAGWSRIMLFPEEQRERSKTNIHDGCIVMDLGRQRFFVECLCRLQLHCDANPKDKIIGISYPQFNAHLKEAIKVLRIEVLNVTAHTFRHSGPSHDRLHDVRDAMAVQQRG